MGMGMGAHIMSLNIKDRFFAGRITPRSMRAIGNYVADSQQHQFLIAGKGWAIFLDIPTKWGAKDKWVDAKDLFRNNTNATP